MKAVICPRYGPPDVLQLREVDKPSPGRRDVRIKVMATAATTSDCRVRAFRFPLWQPIGLMIRLAVGITRPRHPILGIVLAGEIEAVGDAVTRFKPGDQVYGMTGPRFGTYAEFVCLSENDVLVSKPACVSYREAAAVAYGGLLAGHFLRKGDIRNRKKLLVYGASGAIGTAAVQLACHYGAQVTGICSTANLDLVRSLGAESVVDYTRDDLVSRGETYDLVLDAVGKDKDSAMKRQCRRVVAPGGRYVSVDDGLGRSHREDLLLINQLLEAERFRAVIDRCYPLDGIVEAHRYVDIGHKKGNVLITIGEDERGV